MSSDTKQYTYVPVIICLLAIFISHSGFFLFPLSIVRLIPGFFRIEDGVFILIIFTAYYAMVTRKLDTIFSYTFTCFILVSIFLIIVNSMMAYYHFGQSYSDGAIYNRHWFNYLLYFVFILYLDTEERLNLFLILMSSMIIIIGILAFLQYLFPAISLLHYYDDLYQGDIGRRSGVYRLIYPGIDYSVLVLSLAFSSIIIPKNPKYYKTAIAAIIFLLMLIILRQTRMRILAIIFIFPLALFSIRNKKGFIAVYLFLFTIFCFSLVYSINPKGYFPQYFHNNMVVRLLKSSYSDLFRIEGNVRVRYEQSLIYWEKFKKYPLFGAGTIKYGSPLVAKYNFGPSSDVGFIRFISEFGIVGMLWLAMLCFVWIKKSHKLVLVLKNNEKLLYYYCLVRGLQIYFFYLLITFPNFPHFLQPKRIVSVVLMLATVDIIEKIVICKVSSE